MTTVQLKVPVDMEPYIATKPEGELVHVARGEVGRHGSRAVVIELHVVLVHVVHLLVALIIDPEEEFVGLSTVTNGSRVKCLGQVGNKGHLDLACIGVIVLGAR